MRITEPMKNVISLNNNASKYVNIWEGSL